MKEEIFLGLIDRYLEGIASKEEEKLVEAYLTELEKSPPKARNVKEEESLKKFMLKRIYAGMKKEKGKLFFLSNKWRMIAAAAIIISILVSGAWFVFTGKQKSIDLSSLPQNERFKNDIAPAKQGVTLTTSNGHNISLDSLSNGELITEENVAANKLDSGLSYYSVSMVKRKKTNAVYYQTISTGKGKDYHLTLADGTEIWLDAMSSIYFPTAFPGSDRIVEIKGQAYFEVRQSFTVGGEKQSFKVKSGDQIVEVLGTHFNVNAHDANIRTTLLEGKVKVSWQSAVNHLGNAHYPQSVTLKPGQQSLLTNNGQLTTNDVSDVEEVMAWKNGRFFFTGASMQEVMSQLERWYDIEVKYDNNIPGVLLVAKINRNERISRILNLLELTKQVKFLIEGNKITVMKG